MPAPLDPDTKPTPPPKKPLARRSVLAFVGAAAATMIALALVAVFTFGDGEENAGGGVGTGTISISVQGWSDVEGYRLLAGVWTEDYDPEDPQTGPLVGGAFWTIIDSDPFSGEDVVHPPAIPNTGSEVRSWGAEDYLWAETAELEPGSYRIDFWANPGELAPYGSHIPAEPIERHCSVSVEVRAGESTPVVISGIPRDGPCSEVGPSEFAGEESAAIPSGAVAVTVQGIVGRSGWDLAGVLYKGAIVSDEGETISGIDILPVGGVSTKVTTDPFSTTLYVHDPDASDDAFDGPFPYVTGDVLAVEPGTYTLMLWLDTDLGPYSRWMPTASANLHGCYAFVEAEEGKDVTVTVDGSLTLTDGSPNDWPCTPMP